MGQLPTPMPHAAAAWRPMREADLPAVAALAALIHPDHPEDGLVFAERLRLYPAGCFMLDLSGRAAGYALSHPWLPGPPPPLNAGLGALPAAPTRLHLHDAALLPRARGAGAGTILVRRLAALACRSSLAALSLVAVHGSAAYWERHGFRALGDDAGGPALRSYGPDAQMMMRALPWATAGDARAGGDDA